jgi:hypothetical protein
MVDIGLPKIFDGLLPMSDPGCLASALGKGEVFLASTFNQIFNIEI